ncbi:MAG: hypothetical protein WKG52_00660 [Variovorax sp.]
MTSKERMAAWYDTYIVKGWYKTWTVWLAALAVLGPELLQIASENIDLVFDVLPIISDGTKSTLRLVLLCVIPIARAVKQAGLPKPVEPKTEA